MIVTDVVKGQDYLERIGYYRLSGYWYDMRQWQAAQGGRPGQRQVLDDFKPGTRLKDVADLYVFDKRLRMLALDALERIEIALRVDLSHRLGQKGAFAYQDATYFHPNFAQVLKRSGLTQHQEWLSKHDDLIRRSREKFIEHYRNKYGQPLAIWVACEVWDFGSMSVLFSGLPSQEQDQIAQGYGLPAGNGQVFASWLRSLNYLRNVCAHHSRLWNRNVVDQPRLPKKGSAPVLDPFQGQAQLVARPFLLLCICHHLMQHINPGSSWSQRLTALLDGFPDLRHVGLTLQGMGVVPKWQDLLS
ncbi:Abi family protein [Comamonas fluminis]|uniref:Abi family protein n=1 Tax=Comamonas fluminis TaxID=2796366 RepID=UPI001FE6EED0|nr:Abi family protein [Comamonas fluminis]